MTIQLSRERFVRSRKTKVLAAGLLAAGMLAASLLAPAPVDASAFPGANGKIVFSSDRTTGAGVNNPTGDEEIFSMNPDGTGLKQLTTNTAGDGDPAVSSDGDKIVFTSFRTGNLEVLVMNADGTGQTNLTKIAAGDSNPAFSPDGQKIAFVSGRTGNLEIFVMNADGTGQVNLTSDLQNDTDPTYSPGGDRIAFVSNRNGGDSDVFVMNANGTQQTPLTANDLTSDAQPSFSPDGTKIAFTSNRDGAGDPNDFDIFAMNADGSGTPTRFTNSRARDTLPAFSPDGKKVAFTSERDGGDPDIFVMDAATNETNLAPLTANTDLDLSPNWQPLVATFSVNSTGDQSDVSTGDSACDVNLAASGAQCTLRAAIEQANASPGRNTIKFNIPGTGVRTITPGTRLPDVDESVVIDGYSQPGSSPNTLARGTNAKLMIELDGTVSNANSGFQQGLSIDASNVLVRGLVLNGWDNPNPFGSSSDAIGIFTDNIGGPTTNVRVEGNFIGTDPSGTQVRSNGNGIFIFNASNNKIGGSSPAARNIISGSQFSGVFLGGESFISGNSSNNRVEGNLIGLGKDGNTPLSNGLKRGGPGVGISGDAATGNAILSNAIFSSTGIGIDLNDDGPTANDPGDADSGPNNLQNFPVLSSAKFSKKGTTVGGTLDSRPNTAFTIQFFSNPAGENEGKTFVGETTVTTGGSGTASFSFKAGKGKLAKGQAATATATNVSTGDTSEFSAPKTVAKT